VGGVRLFTTVVSEAFFESHYIKLNVKKRRMGKSSILEWGNKLFIFCNIGIFSPISWVSFDFPDKKEIHCQLTPMTTMS